jgi:hypothetical protein
MLKNAGVRDKESWKFNIKGIRYLAFYIAMPQGLDPEIIMKVLVKGVYKTFPGHGNHAQRFEYKGASLAAIQGFGGHEYLKPFNLCPLFLILQRCTDP